MSSLSQSLLHAFKFEREILSLQDEFGSLQVYDEGDERYLLFGSIYEQSCQRKSDPAYLVHEYARVMLLVLLFVQPRHATMLGLGGGSIVNCLYRRFPALQLQAVDVRPAVIQVCYEYFQLPACERLRTSLQDAGDYLRNCDPGSTDLLLCDLYNDQGLENQQLRPAFLQRCHQALSEQGWVAFNYLQSHRIYRQTLDSLLSQFAEVYSCNVSSGNWIVLAGKRPSGLSGAQRQARLRQVERLLGVPLQEHLERLEREG